MASLIDTALNATYSNAEGSIYKLLPTDRSLTTMAVSPQNAALVKGTDVYTTTGFGTPPVVAGGQTRVAADFYRYGNVSNPGVPSAGGLSGQVYTVQPRSIDDFLDPSNPDEKYTEASIRVVGNIKKSGQQTDLIPAYTKMILESVQEAHVERSQVVETFGDWYVFFFGERPPIYNFSGTLVNTKNANWLGDFMFYYESYLRGTQCVQKNARIFLTYGGRQVEGFILNTSNSTIAATDKGVALSFQVLVVDRKVLQLSADFGLETLVTNFQNNSQFISLLTAAGLSKLAVSNAYNKVKAVVNNTSNATTSAAQSALGIPSLQSEFPSIASSIVPSSSGSASLLGIPSL